MRNLNVSYVTKRKLQSGINAECEAFTEDNDILYIASPRCVHVLRPEEEEIRIDWSTEREGCSLIDFQYLADTNEIAATLDNGSILLINVDTYEVSNGAVVVLDNNYKAASWSPDLTLLAVTDGRSVMLLDRMFETISDGLLSTSEQGKDELITVGWGSKETQFQGSVGKAAREVKVDTSELTAHEDDRRTASIKWRSDAQFFVVSYLDENSGQRRVAIYNTSCELMSRLKNTEVMEEKIAVRPVGNYIATTTRRKGDERSLIFYERNGEKRHEAKVGNVGKVVDMQWDVQAEALAIHFKYEKYDELEVWSVSNYDWTRKWTTRFENGLKAWHWDAEKARRLRLLSADGVYTEVVFQQSYMTSEGHIAVVASDSIRLTDFNRCLIPPPMCEYEIPINGRQHAVSFTKDAMAIITTDGNCHIYYAVNGGRLIHSHSMNLSFPSNIVFSMCWGDDRKLYFVVAEENTNSILMMDQNDNKTISELLKVENTSIVSLAVCPSTNVLHYGDSEGRFHKFDEGHPVYLFTLQPATGYDVIFYNDSLLVLSSNMELYLNGRVISNTVTSVVLSDSLCLYINLQQKLHFVSLENLGKKAYEERAVEIGCRLVSCAGPTGLVMQMPRGNLETIHPRPFILRSIKSLLSSAPSDYLAALQMMKKHRIDMNLLVDYDPEAFEANIGQLLVPKCSEDLVNVLLASLKEEKSEWVDGSGMKNKVERVTSLLIDEINQRSLNERLEKFTVLLTALLKKSPPEVEKALTTVKEHTDLVNPLDKERLSRKWLHHISFFVQEEARLFNAALATYDLSLTVQVAEASNRDPKEYLPLLNELRKVEPEEYRKYRIDMVRGDWIGALRHLSLLDNKFDEATTLISQKDIYTAALQIYRNHDKYKDICRLYATHLETKAIWTEAALLYAKAQDVDKVLRCYEMSRDVDGYLSSARRYSTSSDIISSTLIRMAAALKQMGRWSDAAKALQVAGSSTKELLECLSKANQWRKGVALIETGGEEEERQVLRETMTDRANRLINEAKGKEDEIVKYSERLEVVRSIKAMRISNLKDGVETGRDLEDIDAFSDVASTASMISRRTGKSGSSRASTTASVRKRKQIDRKKQSLKEGGEYEDSALLLALIAHYKWMNEIIGEISDLLPSLVDIDEMETAGRLQSGIVALQTKAQTSHNKIWPTRLFPQHLPGPIYSIYTQNDVFSFPEDGGMPASVLIEPEMVAPILNVDTNWRLKILS